MTLAAICAPAAQAAPQRIVALTPFGANTLAKLGVEPAGVGQTLGGKQRLSPKLDGVEVLPLSHPNGPNLEQLASLDPDLVLSSPTWAKGNESMGDLGIRVVVHEPRRVAEAFSETLAIGRLAGQGQGRSHRQPSHRQRRPRRRRSGGKRGLAAFQAGTHPLPPR